MTMPTKDYYEQCDDHERYLLRRYYPSLAPLTRLHEVRADTGDDVSRNRAEQLDLVPPTRRSSRPWRRPRQ